MYHLIIKWILSVLVRLVLYLITGTSQLALPFMTCLRSVGPTGLASGIDVGFSNWGLELVTISLYTMTKSTTIIFILSFAIILGLEKKVSGLFYLVVFYVYLQHSLISVKKSGGLNYTYLRYLT